ncbi:alpha/beta fold hydrolase [Sorangium sp. So ce1151]|uniref:alpha/beta fold hydrolase n=1 Tax=Sorangium sp. So ce1151 TaxID=3133332 RepID=UPI003F6373B3
MAALPLLIGCSASADSQQEEPVDSVQQALCGNMARTATATAQSTFPEYSPARVNDGNRSTAIGPETSWVNAHTWGPDGLLPQWLALNFGGLRTIDRVDLYTTEGAEVQDYDIQAWIGSAWSTVASVRGNGNVLVTTAFSAVTTDRLRIRTLRGAEDFQPFYTRINEVEVNGCDVPSTRVSGLVLDINNRPLSGITVEAGGRSATTNTSGVYVIQSLPGGTYTARASGRGYTFGSSQLQAERYSFTLSSASASREVRTIVGYNRNPIVYVHAWRGGIGDFEGYPLSLRSAGYERFFANLQTSKDWTPPLSTNAREVASAIDAARFETGQPKVILMGHSMGGLVSRAYLESRLYRDDVSQLFTFGSPHLGIPAVSHLAALLPGQPAVRDMTVPGMIVFNATHWKRRDVDYHELGGDAPLWTTKKLFCFKLFRRKRCVSIPWPDLDFRNAKGWLMGNVIVGPDDAFIGTCSAIGQPGTGIDRFVTQEVHASGLGDRDYFSWDGGVSQQSYRGCVERLLVDRSTSTCGVRGLLAWGCALSAGRLPGAGSRAPSPSFTAPAASATLAQRAAPWVGLLGSGQTVSRDVIVEGGDTTFSAEVEAGSARLHLIDPTGQVIDPAYVASITGGSPDDPDAEVTSIVPNEAVIYASEAGKAQYYFPNARPGVWRVVLSGNPDLPAGGSTFASEVIFRSSYQVSSIPESLFLAPGTTTRFSLQLPPVATAAVHMSVTLPDGTAVPLAPSLVTDGVSTAEFSVPESSGYARMNWSVTGTRGDGVAFERGGFDDVQITSTELRWGGVLGESTPARASAPALLEALKLEARIESSYAGAAQISADLVDAAGNVAAHLNQPLTVNAGANSVLLEFDGDELYASGVDGPYTLANVRLLDVRDAALLASTEAGGYTTGRYRAAQFARTRGRPTVTTTGPYSVYAGRSVELDAIAMDPEEDVLSFAWDLNGDGSFEYSGRSALYTAPSLTRATSQRVTVRVIDRAGNSATASTSVDVLPLPAPSAASPLASAQLLVDGVIDARFAEDPIDTNVFGYPGAIDWVNLTAVTKGATLFTLSLLRSDPSLSPSLLASWWGSSSPTSVAYYGHIVEQNHFRHVVHIDNIRPGNLLSISYTDQPGNGHSAMIERLPVQIDAIPPIVANTTQYAVGIIDSTSSAHGCATDTPTADTRWVPNDPANPCTGGGSTDAGAGRGTMRLYATSSGRPEAGIIRGYAWSLASDATYYARTGVRPHAIGTFVQ